MDLIRAINLRDIKRAEGVVTIRLEGAVTDSGGSHRWMNAMTLTDDAAKKLLAALDRAFPELRDE